MATYYVAPNGSDLNAGTESSPWSLAWAISSSNTTLQGGDTVLLAGGTYTPSPLVPRIDAYKAGSADAPIVYRPSSDLAQSRPIINSGFRNYANHTWWVGVEFAFLQSTARLSAQSGSEPTDIGDRWLGGRSLLGTGQRFVQCIMREAGNGSGTNTSQSGAVWFDENYIYNNGWDAPDRGHGHGMYVQSDITKGRKTIRNNVIWCPYYHGMQIYGSGAAILTGFDVTENAIFLTGYPVNFAPTDIIMYGATDGNLGQSTFEQNSVYRWIEASGQAIRLGQTGDTRIDELVFRGNRVRGPVNIYADADHTITVTDNLFAPNGALPGDNSTFGLNYAGPFTNHTFSGNRYFRKTGGTRNIAFVSGLSTSDLATWQSGTGFDLVGSSMTTNATGAPTALEIAYLPSRYTLGRGHLHVWNFDGASTVSVDVGRIVPNGFPYAIYHVFDYVTNGQPLVKGIADGTLVTLPIDNRTPPTPYGGSALPEMDNTFGVFVVTARPGWTITTRGGLG